MGGAGGAGGSGFSQTIRILLLPLSETKRLSPLGSTATPFGRSKRAKGPGPSASPKALEPAKVATRPVAVSTRKTRWLRSPPTYRLPPDEPIGAFEDEPIGTYSISPNHGCQPDSVKVMIIIQNRVAAYEGSEHVLELRPGFVLTSNEGPSYRQVCTRAQEEERLALGHV